MVLQVSASDDQWGLRLAFISTADLSVFDKLPSAVKKAAWEQGLTKVTSSAGIRVVGTGDKVQLVLDTNGEPVVLSFECRRILADTVHACWLLR